MFITDVTKNPDANPDLFKPIGKFSITGCVNLIGNLNAFTKNIDNNNIIYDFSRLFQNCDAISDAKNCTLTILPHTKSCELMFSACDNLQSTPKIYSLTQNDSGVERLNWMFNRMYTFN